MPTAKPLLLDVSRLIWRRWAGLRPTGIDRICLAWLEQYNQHAQAVFIHRRGQTILSERASEKLFSLLSDTGDHHDAQKGFRRRMIDLALRHGTSLLSTRDGKGRIWLNPGHTGLDVPTLRQWCQKVNVRPVYLVHDLIPITHPEYCRDGEALRHRRRMLTVLETGAGVVANSQHTLDSLASFAAAEKQALPPAIVAWPGTPTLTGASTGVSEEPAFIILGTIEGRKNHIILLKIWERLWQKLGPRAPRLLVIGRRGWQAHDVIQLLDSSSFGDRLVETGPLDDNSIAQHLANARALLFPSFAEGYGLPLVEAMAAKVPVIASDLAVFREIGQGVPDLLCPDDLDAWEAVILDYARPESTRRSAQMERLAGFKAPTWTDHFSRIDRFLGELQA